MPATASSGSSLNLLDGPGCVFGDQRLTISRRAVQHREGLRVADVSQSDTHVAKEAPPFGAQDRCAGKFVFEAGVVESEQFEQIGLCQVGPDVRSHELSFSR